MNEEAIEVKLARLEEKVDQVLRRLNNGETEFKELHSRINAVNDKVNKLIGGLVLLSVLASLASKFIGG